MSRVIPADDTPYKEVITERSPTTSDRSRQATFVPVHGAWHGGWRWKRLTPLLRAAGHEVVVPTLTGSGERSHLLTPEVGLDTHQPAARIADRLDRLRGAPAQEHRQPGKQELFGGLEQAVALVDHATQRLLARRQVARAAGEQRQAASALRA